MSLNLVNAFTFVFKEKNWFAKILIGSILFFFIKIIQFAMDFVQSDSIPAFNLAMLSKGAVESLLIIAVVYFGALILLAISIWMHSASFGYIITTLGRYMKGEEDVMPDWDDVVGCLFKRGFKFFIALFVIIAAISLLSAATYMLFILSMLVSPFLALSLGLLSVFITVYVCVMSPALLMSFCENYRFIRALDFVRARQIALKSFGEYVLMLLMLVGVFVVTTLVSWFVFSMKIGFLILPFLCFYIFIVMGNIIGQYYQNNCIIETEK